MRTTFLTGFAAKRRKNFADELEESHLDSLNINAFSQLVMMGKAYACAILRGNEANPQISGTVNFYEAAQGTLVVAEVFGLPLEYSENGTVKQAGPFYALHIHDGGECGQADGQNPFEASGKHYNPANRPHPMHAGDLPPLLSDAGYAYLSCYTERFTSAQIVNRTVIVHALPDDFRTQPSGAAGMKLACGPIKKT